MDQKKKKQSIIYGALTGTVGIFLTKALGLIYASPFQAMAGDQMIFYTNTYQIYDFLLMVSLSGIPFAIASLVAKYVARDDYQTVLGIRKISNFMVGCIGIVIFVLLVLNSGAIVSWLAPGRDAAYLAKYQTCLIIMSFALLTVPLLSAYRGFYQGLKEFEVYAFTQVLEQIIRISFLLGMGCLAIYVFHQEAIWSVYFAVASMSVAALGTIIFFLKFDRKHLPQIKDKANKQTETPKTTKEIFKEIVWLSVPFLLVSVIDNFNGIINLYYVVRSLITYGYSPEYADTVYRIMNFNVYKLTSIPQIVGPGFAIAIIPHLTADLGNNNFEGLKNKITKIFSSAGYFFYPLIAMMIIYAAEIYFVMYGGYNLQLGTKILRWALVVTIFWLMLYLTNHIMLTMKLRRFSVLYTSIDVIVSLVFVGIVISNYGIEGLYILSIGQYLIMSLIEWLTMKHYYPFISFGPLIKTQMKEITSCIVVVLTAYLLSLIPVDAIAIGRVFTFFYVGAECIIELLVYLLITYWLKLPQNIFNINWQTLKQKLNFKK